MPCCCSVQKMMRVKAGDKFSFPLMLDFDAFSVATVDQAREPALYDLAAILIHKGSNATQGHYGTHRATSIAFKNE